MLTLQARISHLIAPRDHQRNPLSTLSKRHSTCLNLIKPSVPPNNPVDVQSLKLIDFHLLRWSAQQRLFTVLGALTSICLRPRPSYDWKTSPCDNNSPSCGGRLQNG